MSRLRRGFKTEANDLAREIRRELKLSLVGPLDPWVLASYLEIPILSLREFREEVPDAVRHFSSVAQGEFSAVTVFCGSQRLIVHNDAHVKGRQASNLAHELSHALLQHPATPALSDHGCRNWDQELEEEADWLAGAMLISEEAALSVARHGYSLQAAARMYGVTQKMMRFRLNMTAAHKRIRRTSAY